MIAKGKHTINSNQHLPLPGNRGPSLMMQGKDSCVQEATVDDLVLRLRHFP
jgi:hypothetical protein